MRVLVVSSEDRFCRETYALLQGTEGITAVGTTEGGGEITSLIRQLEPSLILLDLDTTPCDPCDMVAHITEQHPDTKILVLGSSGQGQVVLNALRKGAQGHLIKGASLPDEIVTAIHAVRRGESVISPALAGAILDELSYRYQLARGRRPPAPTRENPTTTGQ